jgi:hypothetical protein
VHGETNHCGSESATRKGEFLTPVIKRQRRVEIERNRSR